jgi:hypothetical protein
VPVQPGAPRFLAVADGGDADALFLEESRQKIANFAIVIDDEDMRGLVHAM